MNPGHMFGGVGLYTNHPNKQLVSWWQTAEREGFYTRCKEERAHMVGSLGERVVQNNTANILFDVTRPRPRFNP